MATTSPREAPSRRAEIVAAARRRLEAHGPTGLTMRAIATDLGIRAPSLYKHVADKRELEVALIADALSETAAIFAEAVDGSDAPLRDLAHAYRAWARAHPHLYRLMTDRPLPRTDLPDGLESLAAAPVLAATGGDVDRARAAWAFAHGMVTLELAERFPSDADLDAAWETGIAALAPLSRQEVSR